jgi:hypothetical protein
MSLESENAALRQRIEQLEAGLRGDRFPTPTPEFLRWIADRIVHVYGASPMVDYVHSLRDRADAIDALLAAQPPEEKENE